MLKELPPDEQYTSWTDRLPLQFLEDIIDLELYKPSSQAGPVHLVEDASSCLGIISLSTPPLPGEPKRGGHFRYLSD